MKLFNKKNKLKLLEILEKEIIKDIQKENIKKSKNNMNESIMIGIPDIWFGKEFIKGQPFGINSEENVSSRKTRKGTIINEWNNDNKKIKISLNIQGRIIKEYFKNDCKIYKITYYPYNPKELKWFYS